MTSPTPRLSYREREILRWDGVPARDVAVRLLMPVGEVLEYRHRLRSKGFALARSG